MLRAPPPGTFCPMDATRAEPSWRTRANALTAVRFASIPFFASAVLHGQPVRALGLFALAVATDLVDGRVARRYGETSALGGVFDHATDAAFVAAGLAAVALLGEVNPWLPLAVVLAFVQYVVDSRAPLRPLRASALGRWNGIAYFVLLGIPVVRDGLSLGWPPRVVTAVGGWLLLASTVVSMADRVSSRGRHVRERR